MMRKRISLILILIFGGYSAANSAVPAFLSTIPKLNQMNKFQPCSSGEKDTICIDLQVANSELRKNIEKKWQSEKIGPGKIQTGETALGYLGKDEGKYYLLALIWNEGDSHTKVIVYGPQSQLLIQTVEQHVQAEMKMFIRRLDTEATVISIDGSLPPTRCSEIKNPSKTYTALFVSGYLRYQKITSCYLRSDDNGVYIILATDKGVHLISGVNGVQIVDKLPDINDVK